MKQSSLAEIIEEQTLRAIWEVNNVIDCVPDELLDYPRNCEYSRFTLILAQFRHLHSHMGMIMGFIIDDTGLWPRVLGLESPFPEGEYCKYVL